MERPQGKWIGCCRCSLSETELVWGHPNSPRIAHSEDELQNVLQSLNALISLHRLLQSLKCVSYFGYSLTSPPQLPPQPLLPWQHLAKLSLCKVHHHLVKQKEFCLAHTTK